MIIIAVTGGRLARPSSAELFAFGSLVNALEDVLVVHDASRLGTAVAEHIVRTTKAKREEWDSGELLGPPRGRARADLLVLWPGFDEVRSVAASLGVLVLNAKAIRSPVLRGNGPWTREGVLTRLEVMRERSGL